MRCPFGFKSEYNIESMLENIHPGEVHQVAERHRTLHEVIVAKVQLLVDCGTEGQLLGGEVH